MDISIFPKQGYLNTYFGFKFFDKKQTKPFRFLFSDGSSTDLLKENTIIYKQFAKAGEYVVTLECDGKQVQRKLQVADSYKFGNGQTLDIIFPEVKNVIVQRKTTGINIFYKEFGKTVGKDILPDEILNWDEAHSLFVSTYQSKKKTPLAKFGIFSYDKAEFIAEYEGQYVKYWPDTRELIFFKEDKICILSVTNGLVEFEGNFKATNSANRLHENCKIIYENEGNLWQFSLRFHEHEKIGNYEFYELTPADNLIVISGNDKYHIWDIYSGKLVEKNVTTYTVFENRDILIHDFNEGGLTLKVVNADSGTEARRVEYFTNSLSEDGKFIIRKSSLNYFQVYKRDTLDSTFRTLQYKYIKALISDLIVIEADGKEVIYSLQKNKVVFSKDEKISFAFRDGERKLVVIESDSEVSFYEYTTSLRKLITYKGSFEPAMTTRLIQRGHLWIHTDMFNKFKVFDGLSKTELKEVYAKSSLGHWILTYNSSLINRLTLEERTVSYDNLYQINNDADEGIVKRIDGYYLVSLLEKSNKEERIFVPDLVYSDCEIHPSGKTAILCQQGMTEFLDLNTLEKIEVPDTSFVRIDHRNNIVLKGAMRKNSTPRIFDPISFQEITYPKFSLYRFYSPDGRFKSNIGIETKQVQETVPNQFVVENGVRKPKVIVKYEKWVTIIDEYLNKEYKVKVYENTKWFNFLSFSFDNKFFGLAGCNSGGVLELFKLNNKSDIERFVLLRQQNANWRCVFSTNGKYIACYDSNPITYIYSLEAKEGAEVEKSVSKIQGRSIECFSPDSKFIVLSQHKYLAISTGGIGWMPSSRIFINDTESKAQVMELTEHTTQVKFVNFSADCTKLISRSEDGIVIIRNFDYDNLLRTKDALYLPSTKEIV